MRAVIAEDSVLLRAGLTRLLVDAGIEVVAAVGDAEALLRAVDELQLNGVTYEFGAQWSIEPHEPGEFYGVAHSGSTYAVDDQGEVVWAWPFGTTGEELAPSIRALLAETAPAT